MEGTEGDGTRKRDLTIAMSAVGAIFASLVGTNVLDIGTSNHQWMLWVDHAVIALWLPALLLLGLAAYLSPSEPTVLRRVAWAATALAGVFTAVVFVLSGFGFTRDHDRVRLWLSKDGVSHLHALCRTGGSGYIDGTISTQTLQEDFVILDLKHPGQCRTVDIAKADVTGIQEDPPK